MITEKESNLFQQESTPEAREIFLLGVPKDLAKLQLTAPSSSFMRCHDLLMVKFVDKKATGDKEIYVIDSKGIANTAQVERFEKGNRIDLMNAESM